MQGFFALFLILAMIVFLVPFILWFAVFAIIAASIFILLVRFGLLGGMPRTRTYTFSTKSTKRGRTYKGRVERHFNFEEESAGDNSGGWYQSTQEGEVVTLPETALKKDGENTPQDR
ncbi:MAG: hypothetical protein LBT08_02080 [Synergistaceae bacterium]|jgi:hypothetical protein|nr:hypothetical protein [Synergistaceae bacterium]